MKLKKQEKRDGFDEGSHKAEAFFRSGKSGQWKTVLSKDQVDRVCKNHREVMEELGYLKRRD